MLYCVIPEAMADELYEKMVAYYADDPQVEVIIDRRKSERRRRGESAPQDTQRELRDRRRRGVPGEFPDLDPGA